MTVMYSRLQEGIQRQYEATSTAAGQHLPPSPPPSPAVEHTQHCSQHYVNHQANSRRTLLVAVAVVGDLGGAKAEGRRLTPVGRPRARSCTAADDASVGESFRNGVWGRVRETARRPVWECGPYSVHGATLPLLQTTPHGVPSVTQGTRRTPDSHAHYTTQQTQASWCPPLNAPLSQQSH